MPGTSPRFRPRLDTMSWNALDCWLHAASKDRHAQVKRNHEGRAGSHPRDRSRLTSVRTTSAGGRQRDQQQTLEDRLLTWRGRTARPAWTFAEAREAQAILTAFSELLPSMSRSTGTDICASTKIFDTASAVPWRYLGRPHAGINDNTPVVTPTTPL
jgi:hypothetical protein